MNLTVKGSERSVEVDMHEYETHKEAIEHWVNGGDVEFSVGGCEWIVADSYNFSLAFKYRPSKRKPKQGEVWRCDDMIFIVTKSDQLLNISDASLCDHNTVDIDSLVFSDDSIEQYYAKKFLEDSIAYVCGHAYYDPNELLNLIKSKL